MASVFFATSLRAQDVSNTDFLTLLADSLLSEFVDGNLDSKNGTRVRIQAMDADNPSSWFLQDRLLEALKRKKFEVYVSPAVDTSTAIGSDYFLKFNALRFAIHYEDFIEESPYSVRRRARAEFSMLLLDGRTGRVLWSGATEGRKSDVIAEDSIKSMENENMSFSIGTRASGSGPSFVKPLLVASTAGVVVFLFYSIRSR